MRFRLIQVSLTHVRVAQRVLTPLYKMTPAYLAPLAIYAMGALTRCTQQISFSTMEKYAPKGSTVLKAHTTQRHALLAPTTQAQVQLQSPNVFYAQQTPSTS
jgi:hypothetical protein